MNRLRGRMGCVLAGLGVLGALVFAAPVLARDAPRDWLVVDYSRLVDRRELSHSGESVEALLRRLEGRSIPSPGERTADAQAHGLLEPLLEPYAFVLPDALDSLGAVHQPPWIEVGSLWPPGAPQPGWAELLRARRYVVESDGAGSFRAILPWSRSGGDGAGPETDSRSAARQAWSEAWPVLRHVFAAEQRRLERIDGERADLSVEVHAYRHFPARTEFRLGTGAERVTLDDLRGDGLRPALDLERIRAFLASGLRLEGARLEDEGNLRLFGSLAAGPARLLGRPIDLADLAVAYRAVFHGGLAQPYMSLDRGYAPTRSIVNYGGRLRDTALGLVSLRCDIRFKTFSLGIDIEEGRDLRDRLRQALPGFRTHLERLAEHPDSKGIAGQQTRLWFYPDSVDLTLSEQGDLLALRRVRMSAASERVGEAGVAVGKEVRPWTRATVDAINRDYEALARFFPEMADLDQVVRLLSLFAWLRSAEAEGHLLPELESLLAIELPRLYTPRTYPQLLAFNALPPSGRTDRVAVFDRVPVGEALDRLNPIDGRPLPARRRYRRAVGALDPSRGGQAALLRDLAGYDLETLNDSQVDLLAQRAERVRMHETVLGTLEPSRRNELIERQKAGAQLRMFSLGIGGLDLGMDSVVERARSRRTGLTEDGTGPAQAASVPTSAPGAREPREAWRNDPEGLPRAVLPDHGLGRPAGGAPIVKEFGYHRIELGTFEASGSERAASTWVLTVYGSDAPDTRSRRVILDREGRASRFERSENLRWLPYRFESEAGRLSARLSDRAGEPGSQAATPSPSALPGGLVLLQVNERDPGPAESSGIDLRLESWVDGTPRILEAEFPRRLLQRLVVGPSVDLTPGQPLSGLSPLPAALGGARTVMVLPGEMRWRAPWETGSQPLAGEEDPLRLAGALATWWKAEKGDAPRAVVGVDRERSPSRWENAPPPGGEALLLLPPEGFTGPTIHWRDALVEAWGADRVVDGVPAEPGTATVVLVSAEPPAEFALRLRRLARDERMRGRLLAAWCLSGPLQATLPRSLLDEGQLAAVGLAEHSLVARRQAVPTLAALGRALTASDAARRIEELPGPFVWHF